MVINFADKAVIGIAAVPGFTICGVIMLVGGLTGMVPIRPERDALRSSPRFPLQRTFTPRIRPSSM
jgi:hypothetical protein